jgi:hypothetical protein
MNLTEHFDLNELTISETGARLGLDNTPSEEIIANLKLLCEITLEPLRDYLGKPISITSGYRSIEINDAIGGAIDSQHTKGQAADIHVSGMTTEGLYQAIKASKVPFDQLIQEFNQWAHVSYSINPRYNKQRATRVYGKTIYTEEV